MSLAVLLLFLLCLMAPVATLFIHLQRERSARRRSPLTEDLLRNPAHSLSEKRLDLAFDLLSTVAIAVLVGGFAVSVQLQSWIDPQQIRFNSSSIFFLVCMAGTLCWSVVRTLRLAKQLSATRKGYEGELATAQLLGPLLAEGWQLFHDIPLPRGNIDHVLVGPGGVFAVETKYRSKPTDTKGKDSARALYDGQTIQFAGGAKERLPIEQAQAVSQALAKELSGRLGEPVCVNPVVALPGWFVSQTTKARPSVTVINPKSHGLFKYQQSLDPKAQERIAFQLGKMVSLKAEEVR